jgi:hypothetical protein
VELAHGRDLGYELLTALAVSDRDGAALAPLCVELRAKGGVHSTRSAFPIKARSCLDSLGPMMHHVAGLLEGLGKTPVSVIDREADSVGHYRRWHAAGHKFLVRADDYRKVLHEGRERELSQIVSLLKRRGGLAEVRAVEFRGKPAKQFVGETTVVLHRPARRHRVDKRTGKARHKAVPGPAITLRLVASEVREQKTGKVLARWLLLTNLIDVVDAATAALWYYWRWRIESYHKLLKGAGQQVECWQQETAAALARRLVVAAMACVVIWNLARDRRPQAAEMRSVLVRLSGRQMKRGKNAKAFTEPALLAGLGVLIPMLDLLERHDPEQLRAMAATVLPVLTQRQRHRVPSDDSG